MFRFMVRRVATITFAWIAVGGVITVYDHLSYVVFQEFGSLYHPWSALLSNVAGGLLGGAFGATVLVFYLKRTASQRSFPAAIVLHTLVTSALIVFVVFLVSVAFRSNALGLSPLSGQVLRESLLVLVGATTLKMLLFWSLIIALTSLLLEVSDKYGPGVLGAFVLGRYHRPRPEQRCFMFLDMRSSTAIAEALGHQRYFELLRRCFRDMTEAIVETGGEIYQYVGDEVVVSWSLTQGVTEGNCVRCFERIRETLRDQAPTYQAEFGTSPQFKAGIHAGEVTTGEVGTLRKDLVFTGDVLNTAARIQERCNALGQDLLASGPLVSGLPERYQRKAIPVEEVALRGRREPIWIYALTI